MTRPKMKDIEANAKETQAVKNTRHLSRLYPSNIFDKAITKETKKSITYSRKHVVKLLLGRITITTAEVEEYLDREIVPLAKGKEFKIHLVD